MATKSFHRTDRVAAQLRRDIGAIVHQAVREHGLPSVSVSDVEVTRDLAHAKVFVTALLGDQGPAAASGSASPSSATGGTGLSRSSCSIRSPRSTESA